MNRSFPPETVRECENCGRDVLCVVVDEGLLPPLWKRLEANDERDYVDADPRLPESEWVFVCAGCKDAVIGYDQ